MLQALHIVHSKGEYHGDLKPENILLDKSYNMKFLNFGTVYHPICTAAKNHKKLLSTFITSQSYTAPEITAG